MPQTLAEAMEERGIKSCEITFDFYCLVCNGFRPFTAIVGENERGFWCNVCNRPYGFMPPETVSGDA